jgi:hypothetical protein
MTEVNESTPCYFFAAPPPDEPRLYFDEMPMVHMLMCSPLAHQYTVLKTDDAGNTRAGRWTLDLAVPEPPFPEEWKLGCNLLVNARMRWHDWDTEEIKVWVLTDELAEWHHKRSLRLGIWPD